jgi:hypothetical protein
VLAEIADLAKAAAGLRVLGLHHLMRETEAGTAIDILLEVTTWEPAAGDVDPDPHHFRPPAP